MLNQFKIVKWKYDVHRHSGMSDRYIATEENLCFQVVRMQENRFENKVYLIHIYEWMHSEYWIYQKIAGNFPFSFQILRLFWAMKPMTNTSELLKIEW